MANNVMTFMGYQDEVSNIFWEKYGVSRVKMVTEDLLQRSYKNGVSPREFVSKIAKKLGLKVLDEDQ